MTAALPDIATSPDAVLADNVKWRHKRAPNYSKHRQYFEATKSRTHEPGSLESIVENVVKNWEIEASFKTDFNEWRTVDKAKYKFSMNGGPKSTGPDMLQIGTYNALLSASQYYDPNNNGFKSSHKSFKRMMPTFAWEVLEVYSGPPNVTFKWRHWGEMKSDYVGFNEEGKKCRVKAHGGVLSIEGVIAAKVNDKLELEEIEVFYDPLSLFHEVTKHGQIPVTFEDGDIPDDAPVKRCPLGMDRAQL